MKKKKVLICVGARPNLMKAASFFQVQDQFPDIQIDLLHTGQHYSEDMDKVFFEQLNIPEPIANLKVGSASHAVQTAEVMKRFEPILDQKKYDLVLVIGDINSTVSCALVAVKKHIPVAHVEAGLRSFDERMPEEINRKIVDHISNYLYTTEASGNENLKKEGIVEDKIVFVGNTMIDTLINHLPEIKKTSQLEELGLTEGQYCVLTLHRPGNVDDEKSLLKTLERISHHIPKNIKIVFPVHPRTKKMMETLPENVLARFEMIEPQPYFSFMSLVYHCAFVLTDSGGIQEETTYLKKPCFTLRPNTERPSTIELGSNFLIHEDIEKIMPLFNDFSSKNAQIPPLWDGNAAKRILEHIQAI